MVAEAAPAASGAGQVGTEAATATADAARAPEAKPVAAIDAGTLGLPRMEFCRRPIRGDAPPSPGLPGGLRGLAALAYDDFLVENYPWTEELEPDRAVEEDGPLPIGVDEIAWEDRLL